MPNIFKAEFIIGNNLIFRNASENDAEFILSLRTDCKKSKYISKTSNELKSQQAWLKDYARKAYGEAYFIIQSKEGLPIGTVRIYDQIQKSFSWGSWILSDKAQLTAGIESALMVYLYGIEELEFQSSHFEVLKENRRVIEFHNRFGAVKIGESNSKFLFEIGRIEIEKSFNRYKKFLPTGIKVNGKYS